MSTKHLNNDPTEIETNEHSEAKVPTDQTRLNAHAEDSEAQASTPSEAIAGAQASGDDISAGNVAETKMTIADKDNAPMDADPMPDYSGPVLEIIEAWVDHRPERPLARDLMSPVRAKAKVDDTAAEMDALAVSIAGFAEAAPVTLAEVGPVDTGVTEATDADDVEIRTTATFITSDAPLRPGDFVRAPYGERFATRFARSDAPAGDCSASVRRAMEEMLVSSPAQQALKVPRRVEPRQASHQPAHITPSRRGRLVPHAAFGLSGLVLAGFLSASFINVPASDPVPDSRPITSLSLPALDAALAISKGDGKTPGEAVLASSNGAGKASGEYAPETKLAAATEVADPASAGPGASGPEVVSNAGKPTPVSAPPVATRPAPDNPNQTIVTKNSASVNEYREPIADPAVTPVADSASAVPPPATLGENNAATSSVANDVVSDDAGTPHASANGQLVINPATALANPVSSNVVAAKSKADPRPVAIIPDKADPVEIAKLMERGDSLFSEGDIASARLVYRHAVDKGSVAAAYKLGRSWDPEHVEAKALGGIKPDHERALEWYRHAAAGGHDQAAERALVLEGTFTR